MAESLAKRKLERKYKKRVEERGFLRERGGGEGVCVCVYRERDGFEERIERVLKRERERERERGRERERKGERGF